MPPVAVQRAYVDVSLGPNVGELVVARMSILIDPSAGGSPDVLARGTHFRVLADAWAQAMQWAKDAIVAAKVAPGNPHGDDDEAIAHAILAKLRSEREGPDPFTSVINA